MRDPDRVGKRIHNSGFISCFIFCKQSTLRQMQDSVK